MDFSAIVSAVQNHWVEVLALIGAVDVILGVITKFTPNKWDDNFYSIFHNFISRLVKK